jgi:predicted ATPase
MIISRLVLRNWRNFRAVDVSLADRVFIVGPNASGKSNLLDTMKFLRDIAKSGGGLQRAITERGGLSNVRCLAARREPDVELEVTLSESNGPSWRYGIGMTQQVRGYRQALLRYEKVWEGNKQILDRPDEADRKDELRLTQTHLEQISANTEFREIARFFESIRYLHLVPQLLRHPEAFQGTSSEEDPFGRNFLEAVARTPEKTPQVPFEKDRVRSARGGSSIKELNRCKRRSWRPAPPGLANLTSSNEFSSRPPCHRG